MINGTLSQRPLPHQAANHTQQAGCCQGWAIHQPLTKSFVSAMIFRPWGLPLETKDGATVHYTLYWLSSQMLNFLNGFISDTACGHLPHRHHDRVALGSLSGNCFWFQVPRISQFQTMGSFSRWCLDMALQNMGRNQMSSLIQGCHAGGVTVIPNLLLHFKACENCELILYLGLPLYCYQVCLTYFWLWLWPPYPQPSEVWSCNLLPTFLCIAFLFLHVLFSLS